MQIIISKCGLKINDVHQTNQIVKALGGRGLGEKSDIDRDLLLLHFWPLMILTLASLAAFASLASLAAFAAYL